MAHLQSHLLNIMSLSDMIEGSYCSWDVHNWPTSRWSATKKENQFSLNGNGIMSSFLGRQFYHSTLYIYTYKKVLLCSLISTKYRNTEFLKISGKDLTWKKLILDLPNHHHVMLQVWISLTLSRYLSIVHCSLEVFKATSCIGIELS